MKILVYHKLQEMDLKKEISSEEVLYLKYKTLAEMMADFTASEVKKLFNKEHVDDLFRDIDTFRDEFDKLQ